MVTAATWKDLSDDCISMINCILSAVTLPAFWSCRH